MKSPECFHGNQGAGEESTSVVSPEKRNSNHHVDVYTWGFVNKLNQIKTYCLCRWMLAVRQRTTFYLLATFRYTFPLNFIAFLFFTLFWWRWFSLPGSIFYCGYAPSLLKYIQIASQCSFVYPACNTCYQFLQSGLSRKLGNRAVCVPCKLLQEWSIPTI